MANRVRSGKTVNLWQRAISPLSWSLWLRRLFLITLPVSVPVYVLVLIALLIMLTVFAVSEPIKEFWNAPQRKLRSSGYDGYGYDQRRRKRRNFDAEKPEELPLDE